MTKELLFKENELVIYAPTDRDGNIYRVEIGKFKRYNARDASSAFVYYGCGDTAACTPLDFLYRLENYYYVQTCLGTMDTYKKGGD